MAGMSAATMDSVPLGTRQEAVVGRVPTARIPPSPLSQPLKRLATPVMPLRGCWLRIFMLAKLELLLVD